MTGTGLSATAQFRLLPLSRKYPITDAYDGTCEPTKFAGSISAIKPSPARDKTGRSSGHMCRHVPELLNTADSRGRPTVPTPSMRRVVFVAVLSSERTLAPVPHESPGSPARWVLPSGSARAAEPCWDAATRVLRDVVGPMPTRGDAVEGCHWAQVPVPAHCDLPDVDTLLTGYLGVPGRADHIEAFRTSMTNRLDPAPHDRRKRLTLREAQKIRRKVERARKRGHRAQPGSRRQGPDTLPGPGLLPARPHRGRRHSSSGLGKEPDYRRDRASLVDHRRDIKGGAPKGPVYPTGAATPTNTGIQRGAANKPATHKSKPTEKTMHWRRRSSATSEAWRWSAASSTAR